MVADCRRSFDFLAYRTFNPYRLPQIGKFLGGHPLHSPRGIPLCLVSVSFDSSWKLCQKIEMRIQPRDFVLFVGNSGR
jgi:hypothetical protein